MTPLKNRLHKNLKHKKKWAKRHHIEAFRLYDREIPEYPYIVDLYRDCAVIWLRLESIDLSPEKEKHQEELYAFLDEIQIPPNKRFIKKRKKQNFSEQYEKHNDASFHLIVEEDDLKFKTNLSDYLDTGLFLDHRPLRKLLRAAPLKNLKALNLFCYTGSLSVALAKAGAEVTSVDLSQTYLDWAQENFKLNNIPTRVHEFLNGDCLKFLKEEKPFQYDIVIADPPTFSRSKKFYGTWDVERDQSFLLRSLHGLLKDGGTGYFSTNKRDFKESLEVFDQLSLKDISFQTIPEDFHDKKIHRCFTWQKKESP